MVRGQHLSLLLLIRVAGVGEYQMAVYFQQVAVIEWTVCLLMAKRVMISLTIHVLGA